MPKNQISLPDMADGTCTCVDVSIMEKVVRKGKGSMTIGMYCVCELEPKRGKTRKFKINMIGLQENK